MDNQAVRRQMPFYASYAAFYRAIYALQRSGIPRRITSRTFSQMDEASRIIAGFTAMGLIDDVGSPSPDLHRLVSAFDTPGWSQTLKEIFAKAYQFAPDNLEDMTNRQLRDVFVKHVGRDAESMRNVETFFLCLAADAGIPMSEAFFKRASRGISDAKRWLKLAYAEASSDTEAVTQVETLNEETRVPSVDKTARFTEQIVKLSSLLNEGDMTEAEKQAVVTVISYLARRMNAA